MDTLAFFSKHNYSSVTFIQRQVTKIYLFNNSLIFFQPKIEIICTSQTKIIAC